MSPSHLARLGADGPRPAACAGPRCAFAGRLVVNGGERFVHAGLFGGKFAPPPAHLGERFLRVLAENQPPAFELFLVHRGAIIRSSKLKPDNSSSFFFSVSVSSALSTSLTLSGLTPQISPRFSVMLRFSAGEKSPKARRRKTSARLNSSSVSEAT